MSAHARPLALRLAALDDERLAELLSARAVRADAAWNDFFDAAEALLEPASIQRALITLTRDQAAVLTEAVHSPAPASPVRDELLALALLLPDGTVLPPVVETLAGRDVPDAAPEAAAPPATEHESALAAERAFTGIGFIADLVLIAREAPPALLLGGRLSSGERKRLIDGGIPEDRLDGLVELATIAGLVTPADRMLRATDRGQAWLREPAAARWRALAEAFRAALPPGLRTADGGWLATELWPQRYPWDASWPERCDALLHQAELLGLRTPTGGETAWAVPLRTGGAADSTALELLLPAAVDRIFLQNDLSAIAPGPLESDRDVRLRTIAMRESAAQASAYRFTEETITHGLALGETEASILAFLEELSLTGIPQPLRYLVTQTAARFGLIRVSTDPESGRTRVDSVDAHLLETLAVDQGLRPIGLVAADGGLHSRVAPETAYWALTDARYPAVLVDEAGRSRTVTRSSITGHAASDDPGYTELIARLREHHSDDSDAAWLDRELEAAVRTRSTLLVAVGMPDGSVRELTLEATGLGGGRLRGRDRGADVERTLPVSSIRSARVIDPAGSAAE